MENKIFVVTVTYGNRFHLLKQVIDAAWEEGVHKVIVVDNNSVPESREKLREYEKLLGSQKIKVLYLDDNYGSAGGFKKGLEEAYNDPECEFIWLLDDDNKPMNNALRVLLDFWYSLEIKDKQEKVALLSFRPIREYLCIESILKNKPELVWGWKNSFFGFHIKNLPAKIKKYLHRLLNLKNKEINLKYGTIPSAPYGGLFIHKNILDIIGFPNEKFYLYSDDTEWTYRITKIDGKIYLILESIIDDLELSWTISDKKRLTKIHMLGKDKARFYYATRNSVFLEINNLVDNKIIYFINMISYILLAFIFDRSISFIRIAIKAIKDGYKGKLGKVEDQQLK
jgi:GT2 family glycosyltransferase